MTSNPLVSVIVAVYNGAKTLQRCIDSVSDQTYLNKELIIIDGGSTDGTIEILRSNQDKITYWQSGPDNGIYDAWNKALGHAGGDWICFLGSDDYLWKSNVFEEIMPHLARAESQGMRMAYGQVARVTENNEISCVDGNSWEYTRRGIVIDGICTFAHQGMFHHRSLFELYGKFDESFRIAGDYELLIRIFKDGGDAYFINGLIVAGMQIGGITANTIKLIKETARARQKNQLRVITIPWLISYAWAICFPFLSFLIGGKYVRYLVNSGKYSVAYLSYQRKAILERKNKNDQ
ncbi:MAG: cell wall biogenesis glycosyltransferase [Candidatus Methanoperedens nitroreducens]|uniref:Cell wall biogenesis glycosyltransferase n=1 Tax=Candidatus Methanoperedens nitratireducens TaxID=1392998 RepID=A0A0P7ZBJ1_9EURY|nr:glycosyltransferase family 2 protein [Candidatus Methanoperedens sp. BLZ2]KAB2946584.1 MAG: glycosyltransferase [Candidatus Methanoperedens sp.]KPQ41941.1 MAG: cell wall biogenesis glycosyltransferase [Candidatus Methanoperedens sp. BLZ1]MBZ0175089.1 glycosyltransferase [Candidatus Methanoperedens nitroreducens]